jgi:hypothetical protein
MFYEIRRYQASPGRRDEWVRYMEEVVIPFQESQGMTVVASFVDEKDPDGYVWMRRFQDEEERVRLYRAVYESEVARGNRPHVRELIIMDQIIRVTRVIPTSASGLR